MRRFDVIALVVAVLLQHCVVVVAAAADYSPLDEARTTVLPLYRGKYVSVVVGSPGREVRLRLSASYGGLALYTPPVPEDYSATYWPSPLADGNGTDFVFFGGGHYLMRISYLPSGYLAGVDNDDTSDAVKHHGVLGLGDASPLWREWNSYTRSPWHLVLGGWRHAAREARLELALEPGSYVTAPFVACWSGSAECANATLALDSDYTYMTPDLYREWIDHARRSRAWRAYEIRGTGLLACVDDREAEDDNELPISLVRLNPYASPAQQRRRLEIGTEHHGDALVVSYHVVTRRVALAQVPVWFIERSDYIWAIAALFASFVVWFPGTYEYVYQGYWRTPRVKYQAHEPYVSSNLWITRLALWTFLALVHLCMQPYHAMRMVQHPYSSAAYWSDAIYAVLVAYAALASAIAEPRVCRSTVTRLGCSILYALWLAASVDMHNPFAGLVLLFTSFLGFVFQSDSLLVALFRHGRGGSRHKSLRYGKVLVRLVLTIAAGLLFALYTLAFYIEELWRDHPLSLALQLTALVAVWSLCSFLPFVRQHAAHYSARIRSTDRRQANAAEGDGSALAGLVLQLTDLFRSLVSLLPDNARQRLAGIRAAASRLADSQSASSSSSSSLAVVRTPVVITTAGADGLAGFQTEPPLALGN